MKNLHSYTSAFVILIGSFASSLAHGQQYYSEIVSFGASLTDSGNVLVASPDRLGVTVPASPPYNDGRFTNGLTWLEYLADELGVARPVASLRGGKNYAWAAATTGTVPSLFPVDNLDVQVATFLDEHPVTGDELFVVPAWTSNNDFSFSELADPNEAANQVAALVSDLSDAGARHFLVGTGFRSPRAPDRPRIPAFNEALVPLLDAHAQANPQVSMSFFDPQPVLDDLAANPSDYGILFTTGQACEDCSGGEIPDPSQFVPEDRVNDYLFIDNVHFTTPGNRGIGLAAFDALPSQYLIDEDFENIPAGQLPAGTRLFDSSRDAGTEWPWGPGIVSVSVPSSLTTTRSAGEDCVESSAQPAATRATTRLTPARERRTCVVLRSQSITRPPRGSFSPDGSPVTSPYRTTRFSHTPGTRSWRRSGSGRR